MDRECDRCIYHTEKGCSKWECEGTVTTEDAEKGIRSLQAWEEVLQELEILIRGCDIVLEDNEDIQSVLFYGGKIRGYEKAIEVINQKLAEIEE